MELLIIAAIWAALALAAILGGADSRRRDDHEPFRSI